MNYQAENLLLKAPHFLAGAIVLLFLCADAKLSAQTTGTISLSALKNDIRYTEWQLKNLRQSGQPKAPAEPIAWRQVREDFLHLQIESGELQKMIGSGTNFDHGNVKDLINQIKKRAVRLKRSLLLPEPGERDAEIKREAESLEVAVKKLDGTVIRFTGHPVFKHALILDLQGGTRATRDLQTIIVLSKNIKKHLETAGQNK